MEKEILFINLRNFKSKDKTRDFYVIDYVFTEDKHFVSEFIDKEFYLKLIDKELDFGQIYFGVFGINSYMKVSLQDIA